MITASPAFNAENAKLAKDPRYLLEITGYTRIFTVGDTQTAGQHPWISAIDRLRLQISDLRGSSSMGELRVIVIDKDGQITADFPGLPTPLEGREVKLKHGFAGMNQADYLQMFTGIVDRIENTENNTAYTFICKDNSRLLRKVIFETGDDGQPTSGDHPKTVEGNPLDILLDVLQNEVGMPADTTRITDYRDQIFNGFRFRIILETAPDAKQFIERDLLGPLGGFGFVDNLGQYTVRFFWPLPGTVSSVHSFDDSNLFVVPTPGEVEMVNLVTHRFDHDGSKFRSENVEKEADSISRFGIQGQHVIQARGMRSNFQAVSLARFVARGIFSHYGQKGLLVTGDSFWDAVLLEPGDFVEVTHNKIPDRTTGLIGVTNKLFRVRRRTWDFIRGRVQLELIDADKISELGATVFRIAPDTILPFTQETPANKDRYMFVASKTTGQYSDGTPGHPLA